MGIDARMIVKISPPPDEKLIKEWAWRLAGAFGKEWFFLCDNEPCITKVTEEYYQDGDSIIPEPNETILEVNLSGRYYGIGYERGPIHVHISIAEFLEQMIPNSRIFYGGDSTGVLAEPFNKEHRELLFQHFVKVGHLPYVSGFNLESNNRFPVCLTCEKKMIQHGWSGDRTLWYCYGCNNQAVSNRDKVVILSEEQSKVWSTMVM